MAQKCFCSVEQLESRLLEREAMISVLRRQRDPASVESAPTGSYESDKRQVWFDFRVFLLQLSPVNRAS